MIKEQFRTLYEKHLSLLKNLDIENNKLIISFSAVPGSGKTTIAKQLEERYNGVRINTDYLRESIRELFKTTRKETEEILKKYLVYFADKYNFSNGLIILDASVDRDYEQIKALGKINGFNLFVIKITVSKENLIKRIKERNKEDAQEFLDRLDEWIEYNENFNKSDFAMDNNNELNLEELFFKLEGILRCQLKF